MTHLKAMQRLLEVFAECTGREMPPDAAQQFAQLLQTGIPVKSYIYQEGIGKRLEWFTIQTVVMLDPKRWLLIELDQNKDGIFVTARRMNREGLEEALEKRMTEFEESCTYCDDLEVFKHVVVVHTHMDELLKNASSSDHSSAT